MWQTLQLFGLPFLSVTAGEIPGNGIDDDGDGYVDNVFGINTITGSGDPMDDAGHGTHVAGTIGAAANDINGHVGVAWNVKLMACKFLPGANGGRNGDVIKCIDFAVSKGARILNNSWGGGGPSQALFDAIARARDRGVLFVAAAGNGGEDGVADNNDAAPHYPSSYAVDNIISVAALDRRDQLTSFSNYGLSSVHLGAPCGNCTTKTAPEPDTGKLGEGNRLRAPATWTSASREAFRFIHPSFSPRSPRA